jgi:hypothetical protein
MPVASEVRLGAHLSGHLRGVQLDGRALGPDMGRFGEVLLTL